MISKRAPAALARLFSLGLLACAGEQEAPRASADAGSDGGSPTGGQAGSFAVRGGEPGSGGTPSTAGNPGATGTPGTGGAPAAAGTSPTVDAGGSTTQGDMAGSPGSTAVGTGAPQTAPGGYGQATRGGGNASPVSADSLAALQAAIDAYQSGGLVLKYSGKFDFTSITDPCRQHTLPAQTLEIKNKRDITLMGDSGSRANFGIHIAASSSNVIIRNMTIGLTPGGDASDIVSIEGMSGGAPKDIWIDHNELFTSLATCEGAGDSAFDGLIDVKKGADDITVSYNYLHDHHKVSLNGFSDSDDQVRHITFEHNLFENIGSRAPLQRHGYSHLLNNYFLNVSTSCINVRMGGYALVEANYFEKVVNPVTARDSDAVGFWELRNNNLASAADVASNNPFGISWTSGGTGTVNATTWTTTAPYPVALGYAYSPQPAQCIHDGLRAAAGAGKALATLECK
ncbi:MAG TPA: polysaccharide lyase family 1 protein [Polyangiaceae bacterium]|nr:polysaccharide lyase family 1 protein [Polyangiaceae bacterium]